MRTTLTIDPDVAEKRRRRMKDCKITLEQAINETLRAGLRGDRGKRQTLRFRVEAHPCRFKAGVDLDKLNQLVDNLEAESAAACLNA